MNFSSIKEYFYKLYNACYVLLLLPLVIFIFIYYQLEEKKIAPIVHDDKIILAMVGSGIALVIANLTTVHFISKRRLKASRSVAGLGQKLDNYYEVIFLRFAAGAIASLLMAIGLLITGSELFGGLFIVVMAFLAFQWPTSRKACNALMLKGDEYKMVFYKTEQF